MYKGYETEGVAVMFKLMAMIASISLVLGFSCMMAYTAGQSDVRKNTVVEFGSPFYTGVFHGTCQTELYFNGQRGNACATDGRRDMNGHEK